MPWGDLRPGDFILTHKVDTDAYGRLIRKVTGSMWDHAATYLGRGMWGGLEIAEARAAGYVLSDLPTRFAATHHVALCTYDGISDEQRTTIVQTARAWEDIETSYGWGDVISLGLRRLGLPAPPSRPQHLFCSEAVVRQYALAGIDLRPDMDADQVAPGDLDRYIKHVVWLEHGRYASGSKWDATFHG